MAFTSLGWTKLTGNQTSVTLTIPSGYYDILLKYSIKGTDSLEQGILMRYNSDSGNNYYNASMWSDGSGITGVFRDTNLFASFSANQIGLTSPSSVGTPFVGQTTIYSYQDSVVRKPAYWYGAYENNVSSGNVKTYNGGGYWVDASTITSVTISLGGGSLAAGSTFAVYGYTRFGQ